MENAENDGYKPNYILRTKKYCTKNPEKRASAIMDGAEHFKQLIGGEDLCEQKSIVFVDKSLFVREIMEDKKHTRIMFTLPRRWGKTINLTMLEYFLGKNDNEGEEEIATRFEQLRPYFDLLDSEHEQFVLQHCGQYPTIFVSFIALKAADSYEMFLEKFKEIMSECFERYEFVYNGIRVKMQKCQEDDLQADVLEVLVNEFKSIVVKKANENVLQRSLVILCKSMWFHFGKSKKYKVLLLLDEFDTMINCIYTSNQTTTVDVDRMQTFFRQFTTHTFRTDENRYYKKIIAAGVYNSALMYCESPMAGFQIYNFMENPYARFFGFTQDEFEHICSEFSIDEKDAKGCKLWYNGYHAYDTTIDSQIELYNPASIARFANNRKIVSNLYGSKNVSVLNPLFKDEKIRETMVEILECKTATEVKIDTRFEGEVLSALKKARLNAEFEPINSDRFLNRFISFLYASGYLDVVIRDGETLVRVPNLEHRAEIELKLTDYYSIRFKPYEKYIPNDRQCQFETNF